MAFGCDTGMGLNAYFTYNVVGYYGTGNVGALQPYKIMYCSIRTASVLFAARTAIFSPTIAVCCQVF